MIGQIPARCRSAANLGQSDLSATSFGPVCDQDSVMEIGLNCYSVITARLTILFYYISIGYNVVYS